MSCAGGDRIEIVKALVAAGGDLNQRDLSGNTVLDNAIDATASESILKVLRSFDAV